MPPTKKIKVEAKSEEYDAQPSATSSSNHPQMRTSPPPIPTSQSPPPSGYFRFFDLPEKLRERIYTYYLPFEGQRIVRLAEQSLEMQFRGDVNHRLLWTIRTRPAIPISNLFVSHQFYVEGLSAFLLAVPVVLRMQKAAAQEFVHRAPYIVGSSRIVEHVTPFVRNIRECTVRIDVTELQDLFYPLEGDMRFCLVSIDMLKERLFAALTHMRSLVSLKLHIFRTEAFIERFVADIAPLADLRTLQRLESVRIVFSDDLGNEKLVQDWQRNVSLRTTFKGVSITE